jgi:hypothetical protein
MLLLTHNPLIQSLTMMSHLSTMPLNFARKPEPPRTTTTTHIDNPRTACQRVLSILPMVIKLHSHVINGIKSAVFLPHFFASSAIQDISQVGCIMTRTQHACQHNCCHFTQATGLLTLESRCNLKLSQLTPHHTPA